MRLFLKEKELPLNYLPLSISGIKLPYFKLSYASLSNRYFEVLMLTEDEYKVIGQEIGEAVLAVNEQGRIVSVETIITYLEMQNGKVSHLHYKHRYQHAIKLLMRNA